MSEHWKGPGRGLRMAALGLALSSTTVTVSAAPVTPATTFRCVVTVHFPPADLSRDWPSVRIAVRVPLSCLRRI